MTEIVFARHAESEANVSNSWQGRGDAALSSAGRAQAEALRERLAGQHFDAVVASPLRRAVETAAMASADAVVDEAFIEIDLGRWEGLPVELIDAEDQAALRAILAGEDLPFGSTGERLSEVASRVWAAVEEIGERVGPGGRALVVTHGGVVDAVLGRFLPVVTRRPHRMVSNTSLTHVVKTPFGWRLSRLNDATHLGPLPDTVQAYLASGRAVVALIRHGRTQANVEGRWQGQSCWGLDEVGMEQARRLRDWYGSIERVYASPLDRALTTARLLAGGEVVELPELQEIAMGHWEGLHTFEIRERWADLYARIFTDDEDLARGETGETWAQVTERITRAIEGLDARPGEVTGVVAHGGVIRAYIGTLGGDRSGRAPTLFTPDNTSVTHVALTDDGPVLCDYALAPHLESAPVG